MSNARDFWTFFEFFYCNTTIDSIWCVWGNISTGWIGDICRALYSRSSHTSLASVTGLQEIYSKVYACVVRSSRSTLITSPWSHSLGGSTTIRSFPMRKSDDTTPCIKSFSTLPAWNCTRSVRWLRAALWYASSVACSTSSMPISCWPIPPARRLRPIVPLPQYRSIILPVIWGNRAIALENNCSAPRVLVWKKANGEIRRCVCSTVDARLRCNCS